MAFTLTSQSLKLPITPPPFRITQPATYLQLKLLHVTNSSLFFRRKLVTANAESRNEVRKARAVEESKRSAQSEETKEAELSTEGETSSSELGAEIKNAMMERKKEEREGDAGGLLSGVAEEVQEIEWPAFGKVSGTTGVVLGVIAGSSVVLLTVNAILAELSDKFFAGRGVQDFFG